MEKIFDAKAFDKWLIEYEEELKNPKPINSVLRT